MKLKNIIIAAAVMGSCGIAFNSCEDMLTVDTGDKMYTSANDTLYSYLGIVKGLQNVAERQVILNEVRGDLCSPTTFTTDTIHDIANFDNPADGSCSMLNLSDYYSIINNCNLYIANADTNKVKSNQKYMLPEYAQVQAIRAWTYLQLVQFYGEVPFISEPMVDLDVVNKFKYNDNLVNKDNLVDRLLELGLDRYVDTKYPSYGAYNNGATDIPAALCFIPVRLVLGDLYLLRGADQSDYRKAAQYYFEFLKGKSFAYTVTPQYCTWTQARVSSNTDITKNYTSGVSQNPAWGGYGADYRNPLRESSTDVISAIPSSANRLFGTMTTRVADIFGYTTTSSSNTSTSTDDNGDEEVSSSGAISVVRNYKAQIVPSEEYIALNRAQTYVYWDPTSSDHREYEIGDARYARSTEEIRYDGDAYLLASKAARGDAFYYTIPIYRKTLVWLRLAEAINRAGFPEHAFAILKDGLNVNNYPQQNQTRMVITYQYDEEGNALVDELDRPIADTTYVEYTRYATSGALSYVSDEEMDEFFLNFKDDMWANNFGIHARGCGYGNWPTENGSPVTNITGYNDTIFDYQPRLLLEGVDIETASKDDIINAVENVICDELALELAFEGFRFTDLVRMANHKNASGYDGTEWLADKICRRGAREANETGTITAIEPDYSLKAKLLSPANWYFSKPAWNGR